MTTIVITNEIKIEINESIAKYKSQINKENMISSDLRHHNKVNIWKNEIIKLELALENGCI